MNPKVDFISSQKGKDGPFFQLKITGLTKKQNEDLENCMRSHETIRYSVTFISSDTESTTLPKSTLIAEHHGYARNQFDC